MAKKTHNQLRQVCYHIIACLIYIFGIVVALTIILPLIVLVPCSLNSSRLLEWPRGTLTLSWYTHLLKNSEWTEAFIVSLVLAITVALISTLLGTGAACRISELKGAKNLQGKLFFLSPLAVPVIAFALAVYICLIKVGLTDSFLGLIGAHCVLFMPLSFGLTLGSLKRRQPFLEQAALNLGASKLKTWFFVTLPSIKNTLVASVLLIFVVSFNEVVLTIFLTDIKVRTVSKQMWNGIRYEISPIIAVASVLTIIIVIPMIVTLYTLTSKILGDSEYV